MIFLKKTECVGCVCVLHGTFKILVDYFTLGPTSKGFVSPLGIKSRIFWLLGKCVKHYIIELLLQSCAVMDANED